jgi:hypothetical protein
MRFSRAVMYAAVVFAVAGCAVPPPPLPVARFSKPGATQEQYMADRYACYQESAQNASGAYVNAYGGASSSGVVHSRGAWLACMGARGYVTDPNGSLVPPPGMEVHFQTQ